MTFKWQEPNIRSLSDAVWVHRDKVGEEWEASVVRTDVPKTMIRSCQGDYGPWISEYRPPSNVGDAFYKCLRKSGYSKGPEGDYR